MDALRWFPDSTRIALAVEAYGARTQDAEPSIGGPRPMDFILVASRDSDTIQHVADGSSPICSPDGSRIAFVDGHANSLFVVGNDGQNRRLVSGDMQIFGKPYWSWSPDGTRIAMLSRGLVTIFQTDGSGSETIAEWTAPDNEPLSGSVNWSQESTLLDACTEGIFAVSSDGSDPVSISTRGNHHDIITKLRL